MPNENVVCYGNIENININKTKFSYFNNLNNRKVVLNDINNIKDHENALEYLINILLDKNNGVIKNVQEISGIGHRVVHGGRFFDKPVFINRDVCEKIEYLAPLAPLHNYANLSGIRSCEKIFGKEIKQVAVFDSSYYFDLPEHVYMYPILYKYYTKYNIRKYGFHGISHKYIVEKYCELSNKNILNSKIISCHLGSGSSITAVQNGKVVETSMGFSPLGGFMMGTRTGSLDPAIIFYILKQEILNQNKLNFDEIINNLENIFYKNSGLKSISGVSSDDRYIIEQENLGNKRAILAHKMMVHQIIKYIGSYISVMGGCDALIFTGGIGENQPSHREKICQKFNYLNLCIDKQINNLTKNNKKNIKISSDDSKIDVYVISTDEELVIARETFSLLKT